MFSVKKKTIINLVVFLFNRNTDQKLICLITKLNSLIWINKLKKGQKIMNNQHNEKETGCWLVEVKSFIVGALSTNCYVVNGLEKDAIIIDPGMETRSDLSKITSYIKANFLKIKLIVNSHGHFDHVSGNLIVQSMYNCPICIHEKDAPFLEKIIEKPVIKRLKYGDLLNFEKNILKII